MHCVLEVTFFGKKEAVEAMIKGWVVKKWVELWKPQMNGELS